MIKGYNQDDNITKKKKQFSSESSQYMYNL